MKELKREINQIMNTAGIDPKDITLEEAPDPVYPFNETARILAYLLASNIITYDQFINLQNEYSERNKYLYLFEMSPRTFGETWAERHIVSLSPQFIKETKKHNPNFNGEYDLVLNNIRIEVKACRANNEAVKGTLPNRAFFHQEAQKSGFKYHFQQVKPSCCDIFIFMGICKDMLLYWILTSDEVLQTGKFGSQHRNENTGTEGATVYEGQLFMSEEDLAPYKVDEDNVLKTVLAKRQTV